MGERLASISIQGFRSIRNCTVGLGDINVLIGPNGAGKSNFLSAFSLIRAVLSEKLQSFISEHGVSSLLYEGEESADCISIAIESDGDIYGFRLVPEEDGRMAFAEEYAGTKDGIRHYGHGHPESEATRNPDLPFPHSDTWLVYRFDVSSGAPVKRPCDLADNAFLRPDGGNLAPFLLRIMTEHPSDYARILSTIRMVFPFIDGLVLVPDGSTGTVLLRWRRAGTDAVSDPDALSDGTLRFICVATLLLQPSGMLPDIVIVDEPGLGLFPQATVFLSEMIEMVGRTRQVIVTTQSPDLVDDFSPEDIIIVEDGGDGTIFGRPDIGSLEPWLEDGYGLGTLWKKNVLRMPRSDPIH